MSNRAWMRVLYGALAVYGTDAQERRLTISETTV